MLTLAGRGGMERHEGRDVVSKNREVKEDREDGKNKTLSLSKANNLYLVNVLTLRKNRS